MKKINVMFLAVALTGTAAFVATSIAKEESKVPTASIRPSGEVAAADLPSLAKISFQQALAAALGKAPGSVIKAELEVEDGNLVYSFLIVGKGKKVTEVEIDAGDGKVLATEDETETKDDKDGEAKKK